MPHPNSFRRLLSRVLIVTSLTFSVWSAPPVHAAQTVMIGEVAWAGSSASLADEWIELWNPGDADMPLQGYSLVGAGANPIFFPDDGVIPAHGTYLVANNADVDAKSALATAPQMVTTTVSLSNSMFSMALLDQNGAEVDRAGDGSAPPAGSSGDVKTTMVRDGESWTSATSSLGFDEGRTDLGTPGFCDGCTEEESVEEQVVEAPPVEEDAPAATSTDSVVEPETAASSTEPVLEIDIAASSTEPVIETAAPIEAAIVAAAAPATPPPARAPLPPRYDLLRLNELMPQPDGESEWIEVTTLDPDISVSLASVQIHDATGKIATFASGTLDGTMPYVRIFLASSRLNNDGDTVALHDPNGNLLHSFTYASSKKGEAWARSPDGTGTWQLTLDPTPGGPNRIRLAPPPVIVRTPEPPIIPPAPVEEIEPPDPVIERAMSVATEHVVERPAPVPTVKPKPIPKPKTPAAPKQTPKPAAKKPAAPKPKKTVIAQPITFDMTQQDSNAGVRVSLQGTVASAPGLLTGHGFILQSADGRGLLVRVPTSQKLPDLGDAVVVDGTLVFSDAGVPSLKLNKNDRWSVSAGTVTAESPRVVDLVVPGAEDAWSLVHVTGTVTGVKGSTVMLNLEDADIAVSIRPVTKFRTARLAVGDVLRVRGLLDLTLQEPRILPRTADDIVLVQHAPPKPAETPMRALPGWIPFGAAGVAIAGTEGAKRLRNRQKQRALEKILQTELNSPNE